MDGLEADVDFELDKKAPVKISKRAFLKIKYMTEEMGKDEAVGIIIAENLRVKDILIFEQNVSSTGCDLETSEFGDFLEKVAEEHPEKMSQIKGTWHSHNTMGCFWSHIDEDNIEHLLSNGDSIISIVSSLEPLNLLVRVDINTPFGTVTLNGVNYEIELEDEELKEEVKENIEEKINRSVMTVKGYPQSRTSVYPKNRRMSKSERQRRIRNYRGAGTIDEKIYEKMKENYDDDKDESVLNGYYGGYGR